MVICWIRIRIRRPMMQAAQKKLWTSPPPPTNPQPSSLCLIFPYFLLSLLTVRTTAGRNSFCRTKIIPAKTRACSRSREHDSREHVSRERDEGCLPGGILESNADNPEWVWNARTSRYASPEQQNAYTLQASIHPKSNNSSAPYAAKIMIREVACTNTLQASIHRMANRTHSSAPHAAKIMVRDLACTSTLKSGCKVATFFTQAMPNKAGALQRQGAQDSFPFQHKMCIIPRIVHSCERNAEPEVPDEPCNFRSLQRQPLYYSCCRLQPTVSPRAWKISCWFSLSLHCGKNR